MTAPYIGVEQGYCGPFADRSTGRLTLDLLLTGRETCNARHVTETASYFGSNHGLRNARKITATIHIDRFYVPMPLDQFFYTVLAVSTGYTISGDRAIREHGWCNTDGLLTEAERASITPVTVTNRDVSVTCSYPGGLYREAVWAGLATRHSNGINEIEIDATLKSLVVSQ